jgi:hypothetical protein
VTNDGSHRVPVDSRCVQDDGTTACEGESGPATEVRVINGTDNAVPVGVTNEGSDPRTVRMMLMLFGVTCGLIFGGVAFRNFLGSQSK